MSDRKKDGKVSYNRIGEVLAQQERSAHWLMKKLKARDKNGPSYPTVLAWVNNDIQPRIDELDAVAQVLDLKGQDLLNS